MICFALKAFKGTRPARVPFDFDDFCVLVTHE